MNPRAGKLHFTVRLNPPANVGSLRVKKIVEEMTDLKERHAKVLKSIKNFYKEEDITKNPELENISKSFSGLMSDSKNMLEVGIEKNNLPTSDLLVLAIINYGSGEPGAIELFQKAIARLDKGKMNLKKSSYLDYLVAISQLSRHSGVDEVNLKAAMNLLTTACATELYAIEPAVLKINLLSCDFPGTEGRIKMVIDDLRKNFSSNSYKTDMTLIAPFFRVATIYYSNENYSDAKYFYEKALSEVGLLESAFGNPSLKREIRLNIANCDYRLGVLESNKKNGDSKKSKELLSESKNIFESIIKDLSHEEIKNIEVRYVGTQN
jgi:tetratricopeptide (TPR) repeat protein